MAPEGQRQIVNRQEAPQGKTDQRKAQAPPQSLAAIGGATLFYQMDGGAVHKGRDGVAEKGHGSNKEENGPKLHRRQEEQ